MNRTLRTALLAVALGAIPAAAQAADGRALHDTNCLSCHASLTGGDPNALYTRSDRMVNSYDALGAQVRRCELSLGLTWFEDQVEAVTRYLDAEFYHFKP